MITAGRTSLCVLLKCRHLTLLPFSHLVRCQSHNCANRQNTHLHSINLHLIFQPHTSSAVAQDDTYGQANVPPAMEAHACHLWTFGLGTECRGGARKQMVRDRCWRPSYQNLGFGVRRAEVVVDGPHIDSTRTGSVGTASVLVLLR